MNDRTRTITARIERELGVDGLVRALAEDVAGADLASLLMDVFRARSSAADPPRLIERHRRDRFARPSPLGLDAVRRAEDALLAAVPRSFERVVLSPLVPLATHHALGGTPQNNVVSTIRSTEVAADPTAGLALEAADRRATILQANPRSASPIRLASVQRVTRAQAFEGDRSFAHFGLVGLVTAGRDTGNLAFEKAAVTEHAMVGAEGLLEAGADRVTIALTDFSSEMSEVIDHVAQHVDTRDRISVVVDPDRTHARGYYPSVCFKLLGQVDGAHRDYGDGGLVDWGARLIGSAKERMTISGISVDRVALDLASRP